MNERDWNKMRIPVHIRNMVIQYSKIRNAFLNEQTIDELYGEPAVTYGVEKIREELLKMKNKLEKYEKTSGLYKVRL